MRRLLLLFFTFIVFPTTLLALSIDRVVIWGHKLHSHTHSYIHHGFYKAFKHLGFQVYWFDDNSFPKDFNFKNTLFIVASNVDLNVPLREDCYYIYHHCWCKEHQCAREKYGYLIDINRCISIKCFWKPYLNKSDSEWKMTEPFVYKNLEQKECVFPWATDLLPYEIDEEKKTLLSNSTKKQVCYIGTISNSGYGANLNELEPFFRSAKESDFKIITNDPWSTPLSNEENIRIMKESLLSPAIQGKWQSEEGYIPCRIFKAISYGKLGITNSKYVSDLFENKIVYNSDTAQLFFDALKALETSTIDSQLDLMNFVRDKHTYVSRVQFILNFLEELNAN